MRTVVDREKVIKALERCATKGCGCDDEEGCPYNKGMDYACVGELVADALALLKEQEPVRPVTGLWDRDIQLFNCGACGGEIGAGGIAKYCFHCGRAVKWDG